MGLLLKWLLQKKVLFLVVSKSDTYFVILLLLYRYFIQVNVE